jgi:mRNA-degrading endonuclease RelE of RelBE toxin-antitoxin system
MHERSRIFTQGVHKLDQEYLKKLLEGFTEKADRPTGPIRKKKNQKINSPKWNP